MKNNNFVAIMAGGVGSRFWPASRTKRPKQFLDITRSGQSLLQQTVERLKNIVPRENILIVSNEAYKDQIKEQLSNFTDEQILLEPSRNNTGPCVAYTALHLQAKDPDAVFAVLPSDHVIKNVAAFESAMKLAFSHAAANRHIVTLGITPTRPDTGYGYIRYNNISENAGVCKVEAFVEKPTLSVATSYLKSGNYLWNGGIFIWSCKTILDAFNEHAKDIIDILQKDKNKFGTAEEADYIKVVYPQTKSESVDYAILEKVQNITTIPIDMDWSDLGTWNSLYNYSEKDENENVIQSQHHNIVESYGNLIRTSNEKKIIVIDGLKDYIVIDEDDVLLIYPRGKEQEIKQVRAQLKNKDFE